MPGSYLSLVVLAFFFFFFARVADVFFAGVLATFFLAAFFVVFFAGFFFPAFFFAVFFLAPFVAAAFWADFLADFLADLLAAFFLAGAFLLSIVTDFSEDCFLAGGFAVMPVVVSLPLLSGFFALRAAAATGFVSTSCCTEISGSAITASTTRTGSGSAAAGATEAWPSAFHSRSACASRGETSGYSGSSPTVGRIFHDRAHLVPTAFSTTTATPGTSFSRNASGGASLLVAIAFEVMQTSARSISNSVLKILLSETYNRGEASSDEPIFLAARSTSSAPVTTRRTLGMGCHFAGSASSRNVSKLSGNSVRCTDS